MFIFLLDNIEQENEHTVLNSNGGGEGEGNFKKILKPTISHIHICFHSFIDQCIKNLFYFKLFILKILKLNF